MTDLRPRAVPAVASLRATLAVLALATSVPAGAARLVVLKGGDSPRIEATLAALRERAPMAPEVIAVPADARDGPPAANPAAILRMWASKRPMATDGESWKRWFTQGNG